MNSNIYKEIILDHYKNPRNFGKMNGADIKVKDVNPLCGDEIEMQMKFNGSKLKEIKFTGQGCAISMASASLLSESAKGKRIDDLKKMNKDDILKLLGIDISSVRLKCALLSLKAFKTGLYLFLGRNGEEKWENL